MATSPTVVRSLRDGAIVIKDGTGTPKSITISCDEGNLTWTVNQNSVAKMCRGSISSFVKGADVPCTGSFTAKWTQLVAASGATNELYEMLTDFDESVFTSTVTHCYSLDIEFTVVDPSDPDNANGTGELITFADATNFQIVPTEGEENTIAVTFTIPARKPTVARIAAA